MEAKAFSELIKGSSYISQSLSRVKEDISNGKTLSNHPELSPSDYLDEVIMARSAFRALAEGIQANRALAQLQKQKIERSKIHQEGLQYYKQILINKIKEADINVIDLKEYLEEPFECIDWEENYAQGEAKIKSELDKKKLKKSHYEEKLKLKMKKEEEYFNKRQLYQKIMPNQVKKLHDQIIQTSKFFNIEVLQKTEMIENSDLSALFNVLSPLKDSKFIKLAYVKDQFEQIEIILNKTDSKLYKQANINKIGIEEKELKFTIASLKPYFNRLVIGVDRREDFLTEEIFHRLVQDEQAKPVFPNPINEFERNINNKYVYFDWIESLVTSRAIDRNSFVELIRERVFSLQLTKSVLENFKKMSFYFPLIGEGESQITLSLKKVNVSLVQKISFEQYLKDIHIPTWVSKYLNTFSLIKEQNKLKSFQDQMTNQIDRRNLDQVLEILHLEDMENRNLNNYYRISMTIYQYSVSVVLIIPINYPKSNSIIKLTQMSKKNEEDRPPVFQTLPCKFNPVLNQTRQFTPKMSQLQKAVNESIDKFIKGSTYRSFRVLLQINRLITLVGETSIKKQ